MKLTNSETVVAYAAILESRHSFSHKSLQAINRVLNKLVADSSLPYELFYKIDAITAQAKMHGSHALDKGHWPC